MTRNWVYVLRYFSATHDAAVSNYRYGVSWNLCVPARARYVLVFM